ncbi:BnaC06g12250D [Brassica napus]|uniref:BnaC06g12250D protein n=1 Tax=Brassica napus TaxID=3708 RepID=A0A078GP56_BRANA|nr:BnaC06g12250D [Brassica napus]
MAQNCLNPSFRISKTIINHSHFVKNLKNPSLNSRWRLMVNRIRCSASSDGVGNTLRTCKHCKTQFNPIRNSPQACRFHTAHFGGKTKRKFESVYTGGTMDTPNSGKVLQYWHCCGSEDPFDPGCTASPHSTYDD